MAHKSNFKIGDRVFNLIGNYSFLRYGSQGTVTGFVGKHIVQVQWDDEDNPSPDPGWNMWAGKNGEIRKVED